MKIALLCFYITMFTSSLPAMESITKAVPAEPGNAACVVPESASTDGTKHNLLTDTLTLLQQAKLIQPDDPHGSEIAEQLLEKIHTQQEDIQQIWTQRVALARAIEEIRKRIDALDAEQASLEVKEKQKEEAHEHVKIALHALAAKDPNLVKPAILATLPITTQSDIPLEAPKAGTAKGATGIVPISNAEIIPFAADKPGGSWCNLL